MATDDSQASPLPPLPCPFCGSEPHRFVTLRKVQCFTPLCPVAHRLSEEDAWNRRAASPAPAPPAEPVAWAVSDPTAGSINSNLFCLVEEAQDCKRRLDRDHPIDADYQTERRIIPLFIHPAPAPASPAAPDWTTEVERAYQKFASNADTCFAKDGRAVMLGLDNAGVLLRVLRAVRASAPASSATPREEKP